MTPGFLYYQQTGGEEAWKEALAADREKIATTLKPRLMTVLDVSALINSEFTKQQYDELRYSGPWYADFDFPSLEDGIPKFKEFLDKLEDLGLDLASIQMYATGGRGFHVLIPQRLFMLKVPPKGIQWLPAIYKEMAFKLFVEGLDLQVYTARRGRMLRTANVKRENGAYKVPITKAEARNMTEENYQVLCSAPRSEPTLAPAEMNSKLAIMYATAEQKVGEGVKNRKSSQKDLELLKKYKGEYPPSVQSLLNGEHISKDVGFHQLAMQIAITSNALGKSADEMVEAAEGLCQKHKSDSARYSTPSKRKAELRRMYAYTDDNPCYAYSKGAIKVLLDESVSTKDLDGLTAAAGEVLNAETEEEDDGMLAGVFMTETGIFRKTEDGVLRLSNVSFDSPLIYKDLTTKDRVGFEADVKVGGQSVGRKEVDLRIFTSRAQFHQFALAHGGIMQGADQHAAAMAMIVSDIARKNGGIVYAVNREGLDILQDPEAKEEKYDLIWVGKEGVTPVSGVTTQYRWRGLSSNDPAYKSDLMSAPTLASLPNAEAVIAAMFEINEPVVVGEVLGWLVSCFQRRIYNVLWHQFPLIQLYGEAGAGKSQTVLSLSHLHYYLQTPNILSANKPTPYMIEVAMASSSSIPLILDEYKPRSMKPGRHQMLVDTFKLAYNSHKTGKGGLNDSVGGSMRDIRTFEFSAPILFIGEAIESEAAVLERTITVSMSKQGTTGRKDVFKLVQSNPAVLAALGKQILTKVVKLDLEALKGAVNANQDKVREVIPDAFDRPVFNVAVMLTGLEILKAVLAEVYGGRFDTWLDELYDAVLNGQDRVNTRVMSEASKVMNALALMSNTEDQFADTGLKAGVDYLVGEGHLELKVRNCFVKYATWCRNKGQEQLYDNEDAMLNGLKRYRGVINATCMDSPLKDSGLSKVFRFSLKTLSEDGVEPFRKT